MTYEAFFKDCERLFVLNKLTCPTEEQIKKLFELTEIMLSVNAHMNLTAITDPEQIILKHYVDSAGISKYIAEGSKIIDVGCGAGFPSLPLAILRNDIQIISLDSTAKRINYILNTAKELSVDNISGVAARAEDYIKEKDIRESFDISTARAVADLPVLSELCIPYVKIGGCFIAMKAAKGDEEFLRAKNALKLCGATDTQIIQADLTPDGTTFEKRRIILAKKLVCTPKIYPRNFSQISKKPL